MSAMHLPKELLALVRNELSRRQLDSLNRRETERLSRLFLRSGRAALQAEVGTLEQAADAARTARRLLASARERQALLSGPAECDCVPQGSSRLYARAIAAYRRRWLSIPGVVGFGAGVRWVAGSETGEPCITLFVRRKRTLRALRRSGDPTLPTTILHGGVTIPTDVVEFGRLRLFTQGGASVGVVGATRHGTLGTFAIDRATNLPVGLTAMHVATPRSQPPRGTVIRFASPRGGPEFGWLARGSRLGIDAAVIDLAMPRNAVLAISGIGPVRGWRPVNSQTDHGAPVRMRGAVSGLVGGRIERTALDLPEYGIASALLVNIASCPGDSGAALVDNHNLVLGLLIGESTGIRAGRVFSPIGPVLSQLGCNIPATI